MKQEQFGVEYYDLSDVTFIIPFKWDSKERSENLGCVLDFILRDCFTKIVLVQDFSPSENGNVTITTGPIRVYWLGTVDTFRFDSPQPIHGVFHRTGAINFGISKVETPFFAIYDTDCIFDLEAIYKAVEILRAGASIVYPYDGRFVNIERSYITDGVIIEKQSCATESVGGAVFLRTDAYRAAGCDNEYLMSHCPDDVERRDRMRILGHTIYRVDGKCYHIEHPITLNSRPVNDFTQANLAEYNKVKNMSREELEDYIKTWAWNPKNT